VRALGTIDEPTDLLLALDTRIQHRTTAARSS
jgi:hypothetical protein